MFGIENSANNFGRSAGLLANTFAQRPIRAALGTLFIASDTLIVYRWNGTAWDTIGGGGGVFGGVTNGLQVIGSNVGLGGGLTQNTDINCFNYNFKFEVFNSFAIGDGTEPTMIWNSSAQNIVTSFGGGNNGMSLDFSNNIYEFGDFDVLSSGTYLIINDNFENIITNNQGGEKGLKLDFLNSTFSIGDFDSLTNGTYLEIDNANQNITTYSQGNPVGLQLDLINRAYFFGDFTSSNNGTTFIIDELQSIINTKNNGSGVGLKLDFASGQYWLGDYSSSYGSYWLQIDDIAGSLILNGANLISGSASGFSGNHLVIKLNGTKYKIKLENI